MANEAGLVHGVPQRASCLLHFKGVVNPLSGVEKEIQLAPHVHRGNRACHLMIGDFGGIWHLVKRYYARASWHVPLGLPATVLVYFICSQVAPRS